MLTLSISKIYLRYRYLTWTPNSITTIAYTGEYNKYQIAEAAQPSLIFNLLTSNSFLKKELDAT